MNCQKYNVRYSIWWNLCAALIPDTILFCTGIRVEDILIEDAAMKEALDLADPDIAKARYRRLLRASDLSYKGKEYQDYGDVAKLRPFKSEIWDLVEKIEAREAEYKKLDGYK